VKKDASILGANDAAVTCTGDTPEPYTPLNNTPLADSGADPVTLNDGDAESVFVKLFVPVHVLLDDNRFITAP
jgi:hypothetical protein